MRTFLVIVLLGFITVCRADEGVLVQKYKGTTIRLLPGPCITKYVVQRAPDYSKLMKQAEGDFDYTDGRPHESHSGCWMEMNGADGMVVVSLWDDGDSMVFERSLFDVEGI